jgi:hypothetical protein
MYQDSDDLKTWINKKKKLADDEEYKVGLVPRSCIYSTAVSVLELASWSKQTDGDPIYR